ncbi:hypothetical protein GN958_ATG04717, partial [Phytophthora infestans]
VQECVYWRSCKVTVENIMHRRPFFPLRLNANLSYTEVLGQIRAALESPVSQTAPDSRGCCEEGYDYQAARGDGSHRQSERVILMLPEAGCDAVPVTEERADGYEELLKQLERQMRVWQHGERTRSVDELLHEYIEATTVLRGVCDRYFCAFPAI